MHMTQYFSVFSLFFRVGSSLFTFLLSPHMFPNLKYGEISVMLHYAV
jgi:hypothetical protein